MKPIAACKKGGCPFVRDLAETRANREGRSLFRQAMGRNVDAHIRTGAMYAPEGESVHPGECFFGGRKSLADAASAVQPRSLLRQGQTLQ